ncbi:MAG: 50S ribosomal protein L22 [candidate division WOR-3 bacterium]
MEAKTVQRNVPVSAKKARRLIPVVKGKPVVEAKMRLDFMPQAAARILKKCIHTAASNYLDKAGEVDLKEEDLFVKSVIIEEGQKLKRYVPMSFGRAGIIRRRFSHITVIVDKLGEK